MIDRSKRRSVRAISQSTLLAIPVVTAVSVVAKRTLAAQWVDENSAQALALQFKVQSEDTNQVCGKCALYQAGNSDDDGSCPLFNGFSVKNTSWCSAYTPKG